MGQHSNLGSWRCEWLLWFEADILVANNNRLSEAVEDSASIVDITDDHSLAGDFGPNDVTPPPSDHEEAIDDLDPGNSITSLPFFREFCNLRTLSDDDYVRTYNNTARFGCPDIDRWEIAMSPTFFGNMFNSSIPIVRLSSHAPKRKAPKSDEVATPFDDWLLLAESCFQVFVDPTIKADFFTELKKTHIVQPSHFNWVSSAGGALIPISVFVECLEVIGCSTIRLKTYGQKLPIPRFDIPEQADHDHHLARYNEFDIGMNFKGDLIWLFAPTHGAISKHMTAYPMVTPGSLDYGSIEIKIEQDNRHLRVKIYPLLVHVIKSINSRIEGEPPKTVKNIRRKGSAARSMIQELSAIPASEMGGFRIELSLRAKSTAEAFQVAIDSGLLSPNAWINVTEGPRRRFSLEVRTVTKEGLLANANWVYRQAVSLGTFQGGNSVAASPLQKRIAHDVFCSFGWNAGRARLTKSDASDAWWMNSDSIEEPSEDLSVLSDLERLYPTHTAKVRLVSTIRSQGKGKYFPCRQSPADPRHRYFSKQKNPPRWQCGNANCKDNLPLGQAMSWIAQLVVDGWVDRQAIGLPRLLSASDLSPSPNFVRPPTPPSMANAFRPAMVMVRPRFDVPHVRNLTKHKARPTFYSTKWTPTDGNCMFHAFAKALGGMKHRAARKAAIDHIAYNHQQYAHYYDGDLDDYLSEMAKPGTWGDQLALQALSTAFHVAIKVLERRDNGDYHWIVAGNNNNRRFVVLFYNGTHYENLIAAEDVPSV